MKALILAGGTGSRLRPITYSMAKQLVPVANKPVIEYGIESIAAAGIRKFGIIVGDTGAAVEAAVGNGERWGIEITYIPQDAPRGLAHAVATAKPFLGDDDFIMYLGDNLIKSSVSGLVQEFETHRPAATILLTPVPNPSDFGVAEMTEGTVTRLEEKPKEPKSNLALVGVYLFDKRIHESIATLQPSKRGEYEITDAIQDLIDRGLTVRSHIVEGWWKDTGTVEAMLEANRLILEDIERKITGTVDDASRVEGRVQVGAGSRIVNSTLRGPVIIGDHCTIENSFVGPFTAIDSNTTIVGSEIEYSIVLAECRIEATPARIEGSLIGRGVQVGRSSSMPKTIRLVLGDSSAISLP
ncbi:MAG TPA: glucose-1-phosphate thymidylyltransferase [Fimbriimonadaceae bacterium]|nr:glucose-1-phosphate thymidylyltransferase [Fimbriimonadaceae bacterium]